MSALTELSVRLLLVGATDGDYVVSPYSLGASLAILHDGAGGETRRELTKLLGGDLSASDVSSFYASLSNALDEKESYVITRIANRFFLDKGVSLKSEFNAHVEKTYRAGVENIDFSDALRSAKHVNDFVSNATEQIIRNLLQPNFVAGAVALLINAVYFKGEWKMKFDENCTRDRLFYGLEQERKIAFMHATKLPLQYSTADNLTVVAIPYKDPAFSLLVVMPSGDFVQWRKSLTAKTLVDAMASLRHGKINLDLPKFKIESYTDGKAALEKLGVTSIFGGAANLSQISEDPLAVSGIAHKAVIEVSEEGTEAAAATAIGMTRMNPIAHVPIPNITIDRPFLYAITMRVQESSAPLFIGVKTN